MSVDELREKEALHKIVLETSEYGQLIRAGNL